MLYLVTVELPVTSAQPLQPESPLILRSGSASHDAGEVSSGPHMTGSTQPTGVPRGTSTG
jgi:hypothetical protein